MALANGKTAESSLKILHMIQEIPSHLYVLMGLIVRMLKTLANHFCR
jgi:hypothetical protein